MRSFVSRIVLPLALRQSRSRFLRLAKELRRRDGIPWESICQTQNEHLRAMLRHARETTDFWAERLPDQAELHQVAPVSKHELEQGFPDQVISREAAPADLRFAATRGTTQRMICVHDFAKRDAMRAAMLCTLEAGGYRLGEPMVEIPPDVCDVVCGDFGEKDESVLAHLLGMYRGGTLRDVNAIRDLRGLVERRWIYNRKNYPPFGSGGSSPELASLDAYIDRLQRDRPKLVKGLTTYLHQIAKRVIERDDVALQVAVVKPLGSGVTPRMRATIERGFGGRFVDDYGSAELGPIAAGCGHTDGAHIFGDQFVVEVLDQAGDPCRPGQVGEVVVTDLVNRAMPLIRYRIGDLGRLATDPCPCGRTAPRLQIEGRVHDAFLEADGNWVTSFAIADGLYGVAGVDEFQLVEKQDGTMTLTLAQREGVPLDESAAVAVVTGLLQRDPGVMVRTARTLPSEPGGKFRWVKPFRQATPAAAL